MNIKRVLFINLDRIGDTVRSTFVFRALKKKFGNNIYLACLAVAPSNIILKNDPYIDDVFCLPHGEVREIMSRGETVLRMSLPLLKLFEKLRKLNFDLIMNPFSEFGAIAVRYLKPKYFLGRALNNELEFVVYGKNTSQFAYIMSNVRGRRGKEQHNFSELYACILKDLDIELDIEEIAPRIYVSEYDRVFANDFLQKNGFDIHKITIGLQPGAFTTDKMWPVKKFAELANRLNKEFAVNIVLNGSKYEADTIIKELSALLDFKPIIAAGKTKLSQAVAVIEKCDIFISNDTGPMHCAAALKVPIVALFGLQETIPNESQPWGDGHIVLCSDKIDDIEVDLVYNSVCKLINQYVKE